MDILAQFPRENPNPVFRVSGEKEILYVNRAGDWILKDWSKSLGDKLPPVFNESVKLVLKTNVAKDVEVEVTGKTFLFNVMPIQDSDQVYLYGIDVTDIKIVEAELHLSSRIIDSTTEGIFVTDPAGIIQMVNPAFTSITGFPQEEALGENPRLLKSNRHKKDFYKKMWDSIIGKGQWVGEVWNRKKNGETFPAWLTINAIYDKTGVIRHFVAVITDITDAKIKEAEIEYQAFHDPLTGLPNRNLLNDRLQNAIHRAKRNNKKLALIYIDMDRFKIVNDSLGHVFGDYLLQMVSKKLLSCIRVDDTISRIGGDEFNILLPEIKSIKDAVEISRRVLKAFKTPIKIEDKDIYITPSMGISIYPDDGDENLILQKNADLALYHAKDMGGNNYQFFSEKMNEEIMHRFTLENKLKKAIDENQFKLLYQPIVDCKSEEIIGVEALIRWEHPKDGVLSPDYFMPLAHETGWIVEIDQWVLSEACSQNKAWQDEGLKHIYVAVNTTYFQFQKRMIVDLVSKALDETGMDPKHLVIEITEDILLKDIGEIIKIMSALKEMGVSFSIDDFGTGYSSLSYLKRLPVDTLKIDKAFVSDIDKNDDSIVIANIILSLAKDLELKVIAEGVEKKGQVDFFRKHSCDYIQGFYYSKPVGPDKISEYLKKKSFKEK
ncbi:putative bifunctional diguanylate cyclase/phosphodiesterase [Spirochaetota bacterium]